MSLLLDAGALIGWERGDRAVAAALGAAREPLLTSAAVLAQVWRRPDRQVPLRLLLRAVEVRSLDEEVSAAVGSLLAAAGTADVVDAHLALLARHGDVLLTSDPGDLRRLLQTRDVDVRMLTV